MKFVTSDVTNRLRNNRRLKSVRKILRKDQTSQERLLWSKFRNHQFHGLKFYRQYSVGNYVIDFYCPEKKLGIEIDGGQHNQPDVLQQDGERTAYLKKLGIQLLRFWNNEVTKNLEGVMGVIDTKLES